MKTYAYYTDPSHGWIKVSLEEITRLGIGWQISRFSYIRKGFVYIERTCDYHWFKLAKEKMGEEFSIKEFPTKKSSKIRSYERYSYIR